MSSAPLFSRLHERAVCAAQMRSVLGLGGLVLPRSTTYFVAEVPSALHDRGPVTGSCVAPLPGTGA
jgi:hypothetical protein